MRKKQRDILIGKCSEYLYQQIEEIKPKLIICNNRDVSWIMIHLFRREGETKRELELLTSFKAKLPDEAHEFWIVLSGAIGRIDDRNARRLGVEIESIIEKENIKL